MGFRLSWFLLFLVFGRLTSGEPDRDIDSSMLVCPVVSIADSIVEPLDMCMSTAIDHSDEYFGGTFYGVMEEDDVSLQRVLNVVNKNSHEYVSVLFYASWCPFSRTSRPTFAMLASFYPSICHFAVEESVIKPSILSKYGVHGFPTLFLLNSTMRVRYHGSRTVSSLVNFYSDVTGIKPLLMDQSSLEKMENPLNLSKLEDSEKESCPFWWARSPWNMLRQETYLALASAFLILRFIYFFLPVVLKFVHCAWRRLIQNASLMKMWEHPLACLARATQVLNALKEPCKMSNLQEGAINARAWASKSLASVSIGDASSSRRE